MKKFLLCITAVLAFTVWSVAQAGGGGGAAGGGVASGNAAGSGSGQAGASTAGSAQTAGTAGGAHAHSRKAGNTTNADMNKEGGGKTLTGCVSKSDDGSYMVHGAKVTGSDDLAPHVGHTVKLTGTWTTPKKEFSETKLDMVSETCKGGKSMSSTGMEAGKKGKKSGGAAATTPPPQQ